MNDRPIKTKSDAIKKAMDYLAMRDHSRAELRVKLSKYEFEKSDIEAALDHVEHSGWMLPPQALAEKVAETLHRKKKSHYYIVKYLQQKQLPPVSKDPSRELEKAQSLLKGRFSTLSKLSPEDKKRIVQFLKFRGFDPDTIRRVIHDTSGTEKSI